MNSDLSPKPPTRKGWWQNKSDADSSGPTLSPTHHAWTTQSQEVPWIHLFQPYSLLLQVQFLGYPSQSLLT